MINDNSYRPPQPDSERARRRALLRAIYGEFDPNHEFWKQVTPVNYLGGVTSAVEVHHATNDDVVSVEYGRNLMNVLEGTNIEHELFEYSSGGHNLVGSSFTTAMQRTVQFFKEKLK
jgi:dipeptidyl aminopeptidase/acylaminoacyl peptidase